MATTALPTLCSANSAPMIHSVVLYIIWTIPSSDTYHANDSERNAIRSNFRRTYPCGKANPQDPLDSHLNEYAIDLEKNQSKRSSFWKKCRAPFSRKSYSIPTMKSACLNIFIMFAILILPNAISAISGYFYVYASLNPMSSVSNALHATRGGYLAYEIFLPFVSIIAGILNLGMILVAVEFIAHSFFLCVLAFFVAFTPVWGPYVVEVALRKEAWRDACQGFDGAITLVGATSSSSMSEAYFSASLGGQTMQLFQEQQGVWGFSTLGNDTAVTYDFRNGTYNLHGNKTENGEFKDPPLAFPQLGLSSSQEQWTESCFQPGVTLTDEKGGIVVQTGIGAYGNCAEMMVCARTTVGMDAVVITVGRILIALQAAASCCSQSRWS
jgi:hypothetical protein